MRNASGRRNVQHEDEGKLGHAEHGDEERVRVVEDTTSRGQAAPAEIVTRHASFRGARTKFGERW